MPFRPQIGSISLGGQRQWLLHSAVRFTWNGISSDELWYDASIVVDVSVHRHRTIVHG